MIKYKCNSCAGEYSDHCNDGLEYYHACPPVEISLGIYAERPDKRDENIRQKVEIKGREKII